MTHASAFFIIALIFVLMNVVFSLMIVHQLRKRNYKVNFFLLRLLILKYVNDYKKITTAESGQPSGLYRMWLFSIQLAVVFIITGIIVTYY